MLGPPLSCIPTNFVLFEVGWCLVFFVRSSAGEGGYHEESCRTGEDISLTKLIFGCVPSVGSLGHEWGSYLSSLRNVHTFTLVPKVVSPLSSSLSVLFF